MTSPRDIEHALERMYRDGVFAVFRYSCCERHGRMQMESEDAVLPGDAWAFTTLSEEDAWRAGAKGLWVHCDSDETVKELREELDEEELECEVQGTNLLILMKPSGATSLKESMSPWN